MKIGLVCPYNWERPGGVKSHILGLAQALRGRGHEIEVLSPRPRGHSLSRVEDAGLQVCGGCYGLKFSGTQIDFTWAWPQELLTLLKRRYDVLHFHTLWNPLMPLQLARAFGGPKVATFHDVPGPDTPAWARRIAPRVSSWLQDSLQLELIAVAPASAYHLRPGRFSLIPNGLSSPPPGEEEKQDFVLFLGRLEPRKGLEVLLRALGQMATPVPLKVAGCGYLQDSLQQLSLELGLQVEFLGEVSEAQKWQLLRQARLCVVPSLGGESFGIVLVEAMAAGTPPLAAANEGYQAVLQDRPELLTPVGDSRVLAERMQQLLTSSEPWDELRDWGLQEWQRYHWESLAPQVEAVYERARSRSGHGG